MIQKELLKMPVADLVPYENNPRVISPEAVNACAESMRQCTALDPIEVDENNVILSGHTRRLALMQLHVNTADVVRYTGLTEEQKQKYRILANKTGEMSGWDFGKLEQELAEVDFGDFDFDFDLPDSGANETQVAEDEAPEVDEAAPPKAKLGDIWKCGRHRVMCGDSTNAESVKTLIGGAQADMLLTDPPYNVNYGAVRDVSEAVKRHKRTDGLLIQNDNMGDEEFREFLTSAFRNANAVMRPGAVFYIWHADGEGYNFRGACRDVGWTVRQCLIWNKNTLCMGRQDYQWKHEPCLYGWKDGAGHLWTSDRKQTTVLDFDRPVKSELHPTMKPVALFDYQIKNNTESGNIVLDLFGGSGTTLIACEQNGRTAYLMEYDPKYVDVIVKRWEDLTGEKAVLVKEVS